jgi:hypothetical protein
MSVSISYARNKASATKAGEDIHLALDSVKIYLSNTCGWAICDLVAVRPKFPRTFHSSSELVSWSASAGTFLSRWYKKSQSGHWRKIPDLTASINALFPLFTSELMGAQETDDI